MEILTEEERKAFKSMSVYWKEVRGRDDQEPLQHEAITVMKRMGGRILDLVEFYIENTEEQ